MRDLYAVGDESGVIADFERTGQADLNPNDPYWADWLGIVREAVARGVVMRRARIVSEPVTDCIRWEYAVTPPNLGAGELVRWLPRRLTSDIALPGNDLWLIDEQLIMFHWFTGNGAWVGHAFDESPATVKMVSAAFETVWDRAPHDQYVV
ncbi:DUF6879 family protein [Kitasatospora purpeofusca]|uniref:DUF6879 family protein n=1 Tax=Kitasatospora purpeofusca TaxID=67352 RepID=UPI002A59E457|nr:DUF6879 family protein [Kitasatospora purpeofusca]MDY0816382.1 hypothetical protein [Kitasatospora purpeofusca]